MSESKLAPSEQKVVDELVRKSIARMIFERETGHDWHTAEVDPGTNPVWLEKARLLDERLSKEKSVRF